MSRRMLLCVALAFGCKDEELQRERDEAVKARAEAEQTAQQAVKSAREAVETVEKLSKDLEEHAKKVDGAIEMLAAAQNDADRASAKAKLEVLIKERDELQRRAGAAKTAAQKAGK